MFPTLYKGGIEGGLNYNIHLQWNKLTLQYSTIITIFF